MEAEIKPRDIAPQSPIKIRAGFKLKQKKGIKEVDIENNTKAMEKKLWDMALDGL